MSESEFTLIERFFAHRSMQRSDVVLGIGDDCAVLEVPADRHLVVGMDVLVAGRHFLGDADPVGIGHKALAVNLSDLAAMGATPAWMTLGLTLPQADQDWLAGFCRGLFDLAGQYEVQLIGGDTTRGPLAVAVQVHGFVAPAAALTRAGARPGDLICVTGTLGDAGLGLAMVRGDIEVAERHRAYLRQRLERPWPRIGPGRDLLGLASAAIDVSDGLAGDLGHILERSGVGARLDLERLPVSSALADTLQGGERYRMGLCGGDDYELCFTVPQERLDELETVSADWACRCTVIGTVEAEPGLRCRLADGVLWEQNLKTYDHFA